MGFNINRYRDLSILDTLIAIFLTFPFTVMFWRGIWDLIGWYVFRNNTPWNYWFMVLIALLQMVGLMLLPSIQTFKNRPAFTNIKHAKNVEFWIVTRLFMYLHTLTYMFFWHGFWELQNYYLGTNWRFNLISLFTSYFALAMLNGCRSTMWPPMFISLDTPDVFYLASRFDSSPRKGWMDYITDAFFVQLIVLGIAILAWRSAFNIMDELIYPDPSGSFNLRSNALTACIGLAGCITFLCLQIPLGLVSKMLADRRLLKVVWEDSVYFLVFIFLSMQWRGIWNLNAEYLIKELPLGGWVNHLMGTAGLMAMQTFSEVSAFGMIRDGTDPGGEAFFPVHYLRILLKKSYDDTSKSEHSPLSVYYKPEEQLSGEAENVQNETNDRGGPYVNMAFADVTNIPAPAGGNFVEGSRVENMPFMDGPRDYVNLRF